MSQQVYPWINAQIWIPWIHCQSISWCSRLWFCGWSMQAVPKKRKELTILIVHYTCTARLHHQMSSATQIWSGHHPSSHLEQSPLVTRKCCVWAFPEILSFLTYFVDHVWYSALPPLRSDMFSKCSLHYFCISVVYIAGHTAAWDIAEVPSFSWVGGETPGSRVSIRVSAIIAFKVFLWKAGKQLKLFSECG